MPPPMKAPFASATEALAMLSDLPVTASTM